MKKFIILLVIIILALIAYIMRDKFLPGKNSIVPTTTQSSGNNFHPDPSSATFTLDDESITLSKGHNQKTLPGTGFVEETTLLDKFAYGDLNADGKQDTVLFLLSSGAGSGTFLYVAAYVSGPVNYKGSLGTFLGDRVAPESISIKSGVVTVNYLDRKPDEAFAAEPTIKVSKQFVYKNGELVEK